MRWPDTAHDWLRSGPMSEPEINAAFARAREEERDDREEAIDDKIAQTERLTDAMNGDEESAVLDGQPSDS